MIYKAGIGHSLDVHGMTSARLSFTSTRQRVVRIIVHIIADIEIKVTTEFSTCAGSTPETVNYLWSLQSCTTADNAQCPENTRLSALLAKNTFSKLLIPKRVLLAATKLQLNVESVVGSLRSSSTVSFDVGRSDLVCSFSGANGAMSAKESIMLSADASVCYDPDSSSTVLSYEWKCADASGAACVDVSSEAPLSLASANAPLG